MVNKIENFYTVKHRNKTPIDHKFAQKASYIRLYFDCSSIQYYFEVTLLGIRQSDNLSIDNLSILALLFRS